LHTVIERVVEEISFDAAEQQGATVEVTAEFVQKRVTELMKSTDLRKYII
jgi:ATP-dependent HslUV protease ATP-binding subunit HslU